MDAEKYQKLASRTLIDAPEQEIPGKDLMIVWNAMGLSGEAGEVSELAKKGVFHDHGIDREQFAKELGDCLWYIAALCTNLDLNLSEVMTANIEKLHQRYPNGYSSADSIQRIDINS